LILPAVRPGKIALLEQIERTGSLSKAADSLKMSHANNARRYTILAEKLEAARRGR
jgi:molybdenum-dependent DNA-binding transcriptional regulator ModE